MKFVIVAYLLWRLLLFLPLQYTHQNIAANPAGYTTIWKFTEKYAPVDNYLLYPWANLDGVHYLSLASEGYAKDGTNARFLPLYPAFIAFTARSLGGGEAFGSLYFFTSFFIANLFFVLSLLLLYKLLRIDYSEVIAKQTIVFLLIFPTSFFFASIYSESLFLFLTVLSFYMIRRRQTVLASVSGLLLSATRIVGISILPALLYEQYIEGVMTKDKKSLWQTLLPFAPLIFLVPLGLFFYMWFNFSQWHDPLHFLKAHAEIGTGRENMMVFPLQTVFRYLKILFTIPVQFAWWVALLELGSFLLAVLLLYAGYKQGIRRSYLIFSFFAILLPSLSGTFTGLPRYIIVAFPLYLAIALLRNRYLHIAYCIGASVLLFFLLAYFAAGFYIA